MARFRFFAFNNPAEGREDEYNAWYENQHLPDVLKVPGVLSGQRFRLSEHQRNPGPHLYKYVAVYECEAEDPRVVIEGLKARAGTPDMPMSDAISDPRYSCFFEPITEVKHRS